MPIVDIHTHVYPPAYISLLRSRTTVPYIRSFPDAPTQNRLIILPGEDDPSTPSTSRGRPIGPEYYSIAEKISFMDKHDIQISVISLANPWLDFLPSGEAAAAARDINDSINSMCGEYPGRLYAFGTLPVSAGAAACEEEVRRLKGLEWVRGVVMGTGGLGEGLDDAHMEDVWRGVERADMTVFLHPHYGLPKEVYGKRADEYGHVLPLALGFPLETTIAVARLYLSRTFDRFPRLTLLLAHSGGTLPFLAGRLESCIHHDSHLRTHATTPERSIWDVLTANLLLDAVVYSRVGLAAALMAAGTERVMFGTDHPFFPPLDGSDDKWLSVTTNLEAVGGATLEKADAEKVLGGNAIQLLNLNESP